jgi:transketolase
VYDQIRQSVAYSNKNVKICASHAGLTLGEDGATHQILEDIGLMKMLPGMTVIVPCDFNQTKAATKAIANFEAMFICVLDDQNGQTLQQKMEAIL